MGRLDLADKARDEDGLTLWTSDASRAIARGDYSGAIAMLAEVGHEHATAERFVVVALAVNTPRPIQSQRLVYLVEVARTAMQFAGWAFADIAAAVEKAQLALGESAA